MENEKQIEVRRKRSPYTTISNQIIWDTALRPQTRWVLIAMLSLPDDWDYSIRGLSAKTGLSKDTIAKMMSELEAAGYLQRREQPHGERGRFGALAYILTDVPHDFSSNGDGAEASASPPCPGLPDTVEPCPVNSPQQNKDKQNNNPLPPKRGTREIREIFDAYAGDDRELRQLLDDFAENRRKGKSPLQTERQARLLLSNLDKHSGGNRGCKIALLEKAILLGWKGIYPLKPGDFSPRNGDQPLRGEGVRYL